MFNTFVRTIADHYKEKKQKEWHSHGKYEELTWTPYLKEADYLDELIEDAKTNNQREVIDGYLYRMQRDHNIYEVDRYVDVSMNLIKGRKW